MSFLVGRPVATMYIVLYSTIMANTYSISEARSHLPAIVNQAEAGLEIELTRRGQPVAVVLSRRELERLKGKRRHFRDAYRDFLDRHALEDIGLEQDFASIRHKTPGRQVSL